MYLALFQWHVYDHIWDPLFASPLPNFPNGSERILESWFSRSFPVPDAFLGALGYAMDCIFGLTGGARRWRTMPWMVALYDLVILGMAGGSTVLIMLQPVMLHAWCLWCLCSAFISINLVGPAMHEGLATAQYLRRVHNRGESVWHAFWGKHPQTVSGLPSPIA